MKLIIVALAFVAIAAAAPVDEKKPVLILRSISDQSPNGAYSFEFESDDGTSRSESAEPKTVVDEENKPQVVLEIRGFYTYVNKDGSIEKITYIANEDGYQPSGPSIPVSSARR